MSYTPVPKKPTSNINLRKVDREMHRQFKAICAKRGRSMNGVLLAFMKDVTGNQQAKIVNIGRLLRQFKTPV